MLYNGKPYNKGIHMSEERDYGEDLRINKYDLETEWLNQPNLYYHYSKLQADARLEMDEAKEKLEQIKADLNLDVRSDPKKFGVEKVTNESVAAAIIVEQEYVEALREVNITRHSYEVISGAVRAMEQRRSALENLVKIQLSQIHATPKTDGASQKQMDEVVQSSTKEQISGRKKFRRS